MATRSSIGIETNGLVHGIYCHNDGYLSHNGQMLLDYYDRAKTSELIALGDLSFLDINTKPLPTVDHSFNTPAPGVTIAYGRDRGETGIESKTFDNADVFADFYEKMGCEYFYLLNSNNEWTVNSVHYPLNMRWFKLATAFEVEKRLG